VRCESSGREPFCRLRNAGLFAALADWVPPFKGNDTGGIIAYELARTTDAASSRSSTAQLTARW